MDATTLAHVETLLDQLTPEEQIEIVEYLARRLRQTMSVQAQPEDLYGIWHSYFPEDLDLDAALDEIRSEWEREWPQG